MKWLAQSIICNPLKDFKPEFDDFLGFSFSNERRSCDLTYAVQPNPRINRPIYSMLRVQRFISYFCLTDEIPVNYG